MQLGSADRTLSSKSWLQETGEEKLERKALAKETHRQVQLDGVPTTPAFGILNSSEDGAGAESVADAESLPPSTSKSVDEVSAAW